MKSHEYIIYSPRGTETKIPLEYSFNRLSGIKLSLKSGSFYVSYNRPALKTHDEVLDDPVFRDAVRKAELCHLIIYGKSIRYKEVFVSIDGVDKCVFQVSKDKPCLVYSQTGDRLIRKMSQDWEKKEILNKIVNTPKSRYDRLFAALFACLESKSKEYESERFLYLWMAMNGLYGYICSKSDKQIKQEYMQLKFLAYYLNLEYEGIDNKKEVEINKLLTHIELLCQKVKREDIPGLVKDLKNKNADNLFIKELMENLQRYFPEARMEPYALMTIWFPYKIRCKYFHGERNMPILCFEDENPLPALKIVNQLLEDLVDKTLPGFFDIKKLDGEISDKIKSI